MFLFIISEILNIMDVFDGFQKLQKVLPLLFLPLLFWDLIPRGYIFQIKK